MDSYVNFLKSFFLGVNYERVYVLNFVFVGIEVWPGVIYQFYIYMLLEYGNTNLNDSPLKSSHTQQTTLANHKGHSSVDVISLTWEGEGRVDTISTDTPDSSRYLGADMRITTANISLQRLLLCALSASALAGYHYRRNTPTGALVTGSARYVVRPAVRVARDQSEWLNYGYRCEKICLTKVICTILVTKQHLNQNELHILNVTVHIPFNSVIN